MDFDAYIAPVIDREGGFVDHPDDPGGATCWGITEHVARAFGYAGPMQDLPRSTAVAIYRGRYWTQPGFDAIDALSPSIAAELLDTGVNMGTGVAATFLQRALNVLNLRGELFPDVTVDGSVGKVTTYALKRYLAKRGAEGERVLLGMLNALQSARYIELAEDSPRFESFEYGWQRTRVAMPSEVKP